MGPYYPTWMEVNLHQFAENLRTIKLYLGSTLFCLPVKANAYGMGLLSMSQAAEKNGVEYLGVSSCQEGVLLRKSGIHIPILVFGALHEPEIASLLAYDLEFTISSIFKAQQVQAHLQRMGKSCAVHLEVDTGMQRTGMQPHTFWDLYEFVKSQPCFVIKGISSHFANSEEANSAVTQHQLALFDSIQRRIPDSKSILFHIANSGALMLGASDTFCQMARPGGLAFGLVEPAALGKGPLRSIRPLVTVKSRISFVKTVPPGAGVSYGHTYVASQEVRIATVPIGYGDGYRRGLSNRGHVLIRGDRYPIVGNICMDQLMVDMGDAPAYVGEEVVLLGQQGGGEISAFELAHFLGTHPYEILCAFTERVPRVYV